ncbi:MAG: hypothetical protein ACYTHK_09545 [Planctomycetota bacterium]
MKAAVIGICLLGCAGVWGWALLGQEKVEPLPADLVGTFELFDFRAPEGVQSPVGQGQKWVYEFTADNRFILRALVDNRMEMSRSSGTIIPEGKDVLKLTHVSEDGVASDRRTERFKVMEAFDDKGAYITLAQVLEGGTGVELMLRRQ